MRRNPGAIRFGIQARVVGLALLFTLLAAGMVLASSAAILSAQLRRTTLQSAEYALQTAAAGIRQDIAEVDALADWCATAPTVRTAMLTPISTASLTHTYYPIISNKFNSTHAAAYIQRFMIINNSGQSIMLGTAASQSSTVRNGDIHLFPGLEEGGTGTQWERIAQDPRMQAGASLTGIPITRSMSAGGGVYRAYVYLSVSTGLITDQLRQFSLAEGAWLCWIMGDTLYRVERGALEPIGSVDQLPEPDQGTGDTLDAGTLLYAASLEGRSCSVVACPLGVHQLYLAMVLPEGLMEPPLHLLVSPAFLSLAVLLVMGLGLALLLHRTVGAPIKALRRQIDTISGGDFSVDPSIEWNHELGDVGRGINDLSRSVSILMARRLEDEKQKRELEYRMLQNQISPHFIYNTLNSIKWMATIQHAPGVAEMVTALSRLLKNASKGTARLVRLQEEFELLEDYFTIQRYRYGGTITMDIRPPEEELAASCRIPRFTLQPLAENAIFHGIEPKGAAGSIKIRVYRNETGCVCIDVTDDGIGMDEATIAGLLAEDKKSKSNFFKDIGISNVHKRLQYEYGEAYGLSFASEPGAFTTVTVTLPEKPCGGASQQTGDAAMQSM